MNEFLTFPLANEAEQEPDSKEALPSLSDVKDAKEWVDFNEK